MQHMEARSCGSVGLELQAWNGVGETEGEGEDQMKKPEKSLLQRAQDKLIQTLPTFSSVDSNDLKVRGVGVWMAGLYLVLYLTSGAYLLAMGTTSEYNKQYLSLTNDKGNSICEKIPVAVTGTFQADKSGTWSSSKSFQPENSIYELKMTGTQANEEQYSAVMQNFTAQFKAFGDSTTSLDIIGQLIAWSLFSVRDPDTIMELSTDAELGRMLAGVVPPSKSKPIFSSAEGVCMYDGLEPTFSSQGLVLTASFPANAPPSAAPTPFPTAIRSSTAEPSSGSGSNDDHGGSSEYYEFCPKQISVSVGTFGLRLSDQRSVDIDLFNAALAFALNFGLVNTNLLSKADSEEWDYGGEVGKVLEETWTSDRYPGSSVRCVTKTGQPRVCFALYGSYTYVYPVLTTTKDIQAATPECLCPEDAKNEGCNYNSYFQLALVFSKDDFYANIISAGWKLQSMLKTDGPKKVKSLVEGLAYTAYQLDMDSSWWKLIYGHYSSDYDDWLKGATTINGDPIDVPPYSEFKKSFELMGPGISIMSFRLFNLGESAPFNAGGVSLEDLATTTIKGEYGNYTLVSCTDTIFQPSALQHMSLVPPVSVVQPYLSCHPSLPRAFLTAAGLAAANSALISSIFLSLFVATTVFYFNNIHKSPKLKIVPPAEKSVKMAEAVKMLEEDNQRLRSDFQQSEERARILSSKMEMLERMVLGSAGLDTGPAPVAPDVGVGVGVGLDPGPAASPIASPVASQPRGSVSGHAFEVFGLNPLHSSSRGSFTAADRGSVGGRGSHSGAEALRQQHNSVPFSVSDVVTADGIQQKYEALKEQREKVVQAERRLSRGSIGGAAAASDGSFTR